MNVFANAYRHCSRVNPTALWRFAGFLSTGKVARTWDSGTRLTPSVGAELTATPAAPGWEAVADYAVDWAARHAVQPTAT